MTQLNSPLIYPLRLLRSRTSVAFACLQIAVFCLMIFITTQAGATSQILEQCRALSLAEDDIHNCLDNHLDVLDENIEDLEAFIRNQLSGNNDVAVLQAFEASQSAFRTFRSANCLWYVEFSSPKAVADQIGKNCLATHSESRLSEMQQLLKTESAADIVSGYYVYGANRNTFQPCGSESRYWVEGENVVVSELQQSYLNEATADLQVLYTELAGQVDAEATDTFPEHDGVFRIESLASLRLPLDSDCRIARSADVPVTAEAPSTEAETATVDEDPAPVEATTVDDDPTQSLTAYFGDWIARCEQIGTKYGCVLSVGMETPGAESPADNAVLRITRRSQARTVLDVDVPLGVAPGLNDLEQLHWNIDSVKFGALLHSELRPADSQSGTTFSRQALRERWFIRDELLPVMKNGRRLSIDVFPGEDGALTLVATLNGLTRALEFADDFTAAEEEN